VLFIGNSLTAANDLPAVVASLSRGRIAYRTVAPGGVSLEDHWNFTGARDALENGTWDYVVLQQGPSTLPESAANLRDWAVRWGAAIRNHGAKPAVYEVWPDSAFGVRLSFPAVIRSYRAAADAARALLLPRGRRGGLRGGASPGSASTGRTAFTRRSSERRSPHSSSVRA